MSNARVHYEMAAGRRAALAKRGGGKEAPNTQVNGEGGSSRLVLELDRTPCTLVLVLHEEVVNYHPGMAYFGGIFGDGEVSVRALDFILEGSFPVQATLDLAGFWRMRGFTRFSLVHMVLFCIRQCFGR
jgi:hypothetical protein